MKISASAFQEEYRQTLQPARARRWAATSTPSRRGRSACRSSVLNRMVEGALFDQAAADLGPDHQRRRGPRAASRPIRASATRPARSIREVFRETLRRNGFTEDRYVGLLRREMQREQIIIQRGRRRRAAAQAWSRRSSNTAASAASPNMCWSPTRRSPGSPIPTSRPCGNSTRITPGCSPRRSIRAVTVVVLSRRRSARRASASARRSCRRPIRSVAREFAVPERRSFRQMVFADEAARAARARAAGAGRRFRRRRRRCRRRRRQVTPIGPVAARATAGRTGGRRVRAAPGQRERADQDPARLAHHRGHRRSSRAR